MENNDNDEFDKSIENLFTQLMTTTQKNESNNIEHQQTQQIHEYYGQFFNQKVDNFEQIEGKIELMLQLIQSKTDKDMTKVEKAVRITRKRDGLLKDIKHSVDVIKSEGFELRADNSANPPSQSERKNRENFCDFILKDIDNDILLKASDVVTPAFHQIISNINFPKTTTAESDVVTPCSLTDETSSNQSTITGSNSKILPRLRYKRSFTSMTTTPESNTSPCKNDAWSRQTNTKRKLNS